MQIHLTPLIKKKQLNSKYFVVFMNLFPLTCIFSKETNFFMHSIILKPSNQTLYYCTSETVIRNPIGKVSATLIEYVITAVKEDAANQRRILV